LKPSLERLKIFTPIWTRDFKAFTPSLNPMTQCHLPTHFLGCFTLFV